MIKWEEKYSVGFDEIDTQHKILIDIIVELATAIKNKANDFSTTLSILQELDSYVEEHFSYEEREMEKYNYHNIESHKKAHGIFRDKMRELNVFSISKEMRLEFLNDMLVYNVNWLLEHIMKTDKLLGAFLSSQPLKV